MKKISLLFSNRQNFFWQSFSFRLCSCLAAVFSALVVGVWVLPNTAQAQPPHAVYSLTPRSADDVSAQYYAARRMKLLRTMSDRAFAVFFAADVRNRQYDVDYEYRQSSDMLYLCGFPEPKSALLLVPGGIVLSATLDSAFATQQDTTRHTALLFVQQRIPNEELWTGAITGRERAEERYGIKTLEYGLFAKVLALLCTSRDTLCITALPTDALTEPLAGTTVRMSVEARKVLSAQHPHLILSGKPRRILDSLRRIKDSAELTLLQKAITMTAEGHKAVMRSVRPKMMEYECEAVMESTFRRLGAEDVGYPSIMGSGNASCILHYTSNRKQTQAGDVLLMDCGAEYHGYTADITRTIPVNGRFSAEQRTLYDLVYKAQQAAIAVYKPGNDWRLAHSRAVEVIRAGLLNLGIIKQADEYKWYFPHGLVHHIGLDVHDTGYTGYVFQPDMVLTCEPGIYIPEGSPCDKKWWNIGIRIEDDILVTTGEPIILSKTLPRSAEEVEAWMQSGKKGR
jgi:Xaa-Pro aminopeptidase